MNENAAALSPLKDARVVLGVTGGIAAYKSALLARELLREGASVDVVLTRAAAQFVGAPTFSGLTGRPVWQDAWDDRVANTMPHIALSRGATAILIAPATADFLAKLAHGLADDLLTTLCAARQRDLTPLLVVPAMNREMWENPANQRNVALLRGDGIHVLGPGEGDQACGETGAGRMLEPLDILEGLLRGLTPQRLAQVRVLMTAGPTREPIDPVRTITNRSSGQMGFALARALSLLGADVTVVAGPVALPTPHGVRRIEVTTAQSMLEAVMTHVASTDVFIAVAAVADYTPAQPSAQKIKKSMAARTIELLPTVDILRTVAALPVRPYCVGFAAETHDVLPHARAKRIDKRLDMIIANHAETAIGQATNAVTIIDDHGEVSVPSAPKAQIAQTIAHHIAAHLPKR